MLKPKTNPSFLERLNQFLSGIAEPIKNLSVIVTFVTAAFAFLSNYAPHSGLTNILGTLFDPLFSQRYETGYIFYEQPKPGASEEHAQVALVPGATRPAYQEIKPGSIVTPLSQVYLRPQASSATPNDGLKVYVPGQCLEVVSQARELPAADLKDGLSAGWLAVRDLGEKQINALPAAQQSSCKTPG